jgi:hypothetical protein
MQQKTFLILFLSSATWQSRDISNTVERARFWANHHHRDVLLERDALILIPGPLAPRIRKTPTLPRERKLLSKLIPQQRLCFKVSRALNDPFQRLIASTLSHLIRSANFVLSSPRKLFMAQ